MACIYKITNIKNNKSYIGHSTTGLKRVEMHLNLKSRCPAITAAIRKYGRESFKIELLLEHPDSKFTLNIMEPYYIEKYNTLAPNGYNLTKGGEGSLGRKVSKKSLDRFKAMTKAKWKSKKYRKILKEAALRRKGYKHKEESKKKMSDSVKDRWKNMSKKERKHHTDLCVFGKLKCGLCKPLIYNEKYYMSLREAARLIKRDRDYIKVRCIFITKEEYLNHIL